MSCHRNKAGPSNQQCWYVMAGVSTQYAAKLDRKQHGTREIMHELMATRSEEQRKEHRGEKLVAQAATVPKKTFDKPYCAICN